MRIVIVALLALIAAALGPLASPARADEAVALSGGYGLLNAPRAPRAAIVLIPGGNGHLGIRPDGSQYRIANNAYSSSEVAGVCFSPDSEIMFLNIQYPGMTLAVTGPWPA